MGSKESSKASLNFWSALVAGLCRTLIATVVGDYPHDVVLAIFAHARTLFRFPLGLGCIRKRQTLLARERN